ncbi:hypothetical protein llap_7989 [Limosa lapponica baueri]|uniref:Uncharacterized protein n=1 Tax=Limosa lapponica baueri TaxID=1758121 RepID=A0A2I0U6L1_LIMLA|nr:hypothetical protein llap_7989 [Limosa lapponica baueri]
MKSLRCRTSAVSVLGFCCEARLVRGVMPSRRDARLALRPRDVNLVKVNCGNIKCCEIANAEAFLQISRKPLPPVCCVPFGSLLKSAETTKFYITQMKSCHYLSLFHPLHSLCPADAQQDDFPPKGCT